MPDKTDIRTKCKDCGDILRGEDAREARVKTGGMIFCSCGKTGLDWMLGTDRFRILGNATRMAGGSDA